jgi:hypothetical protein
MKTIDQVLRLLPRLTKHELDEVKEQINLLRTVGPSTQREVGDEASELLQAIVTFLSSRGLEYNTMAMLRKVDQYEAFADKAKNVFRFMKGVEGRTKKRAFLSLAAELLYDDLTSMDVAVSARTMMSHTHRIPAVINKNFPGYARAGMLGIIVRTR